MIKQILILSILFVFWIGCKQQDTNREEKAGRIVSLSPNITETIYALAAQDLLVGVSDFCNYPAEVRQKTRVGGLLNPNIERIISLEPDLLLGTPANAKTADLFKGKGIRTVLLANDRLRDVFLTIDSVSVLCNVTQKGDSLIGAIKDSLEFYRRLTQQAAVDSPRTLFVLHRDPGTTRNISVIGPGTFTDDLWNLLGGKNAFESSGLKYAQLNNESLLTIDPDLIIEFKFNQRYGQTQRRRNRAEWQALNRLKAVKQGQIYVIDGNYSLIPGPRVTRLARDYYRIMRRYHKYPNNR